MTTLYKILLQTICLLCLCSSVVYAQNIDNYAFSTNTSASLVDMSSGTTQLVGPSQNFLASAVTNIGFDVWFMGVRYTQFSVNHNGVLRFGGTQVNTGGNTYLLADNARVSPLSSDTNLDSENKDTQALTGTMATSSTGKVHYKVIGTSPNRALVVEWKNMKINHNNPSSDFATFQALIYESNPNAGNTVGGKVEFIYGAMPTNAKRNNGNNASIDVRLGIGENLRGKGVNIGGGTPTASVVTVATETSISSGSNAPLLHSTADGSRRYMAFEPPATTGEASNFSIDCPGTSTLFLTWTESATNGSGAVVFRSTDGVNYSFVKQVALGELSYTDTGLANNTTYHYRVYLVNEGKFSALGAAASGSATTSSSGSSSGAIFSVDGGNWHDPTNWSTNTIPGAGDDVIICGHAIRIYSSSTLYFDMKCKNIAIANGGSLTFGKQSVGNQNPILTVSGNLANGGTIDLADVNATLSVAGSVSNSGTFDMGDSGGSMSIAGNLNNSGTLDLGTNTNISLTVKGNVVNSGTWTAGLATVTLDGTALQTLSNTGTSKKTVFGTPTTTTYTFTLPSPATIPDNNDRTYGLIITDISIITDINAIINIEHTDIGQLEVDLISPSGTTQKIIDFTDNSCSRNDVNATLDDESGGASVNAQCNSGGAGGATGNYKPGSPLSVFDGENLQGQWIFKIYDRVADGSGGFPTNLQLIVASTPTTTTTLTGISFYKLVVNNTSAAGVNATNTSIYISNSATLTDGVVTMANTFEVIFQDDATCTVGTAACYIDGTVRKIGNEAFDFPVGDDGYSANLGITAPTAPTDEFTVTYHHSNPTAYNISSKEGTINNVGNCEYWMVERAVGSSAVSLSLSYDDTRSCGATVPADLLVAHWNGTMWEDKGNGGAATNFTGIRSGVPLNSFSPIGLGSGSGSNVLLPITLLDFQVQEEEDAVAIEWATTDAVNFSHFEVERSADGLQFNVLERVIPKNNTTEATQTYVVYDEEAINMNVSQWYYRLKMVDNDSSFAYSPVRGVSLQEQVAPITVTNPFSHTLKVKWSKRMEEIAYCTLLNIEGKTVATQEIPDDGRLSWEWQGLGALPQGVYILQMQTSKGIESIKIYKK